MYTSDFLLFSRMRFIRVTLSWSCLTRPGYITLTADFRMLHLNLFIMRLSIPFRSSQAQFQGDALGFKRGLRYYTKTYDGSQKASFELILLD